MTRRPSFDRDGFIPGLKPRGHEDVLGLTVRELVASLPQLAEEATCKRRPDDEEPLEWPNDLEAVRTFLRRHGHLRRR